VTSPEPAPGSAAKREDTLPLVSVVIRSMDRPTLDAALASIAAQDYPRIEAVVVAACGSAHRTLPDRIGTLAVRLVRSDVRLARAAAANAGLDAAAGEWITFLDDDDVMLAGHLSGLVAARAHAPTAGVIHCRARAVFADGRVQRFGHPFNLIQLYERNFVHPAAMIFGRWLVERGCRCDEALPMHEDWDLCIQFAQHATFSFIPQDSVQWNADIGSSGAGGGINHDDAKFVLGREAVYAKWAAQRDAAIDAVEPLLRAAGALAQRRDYAGAQAHIRNALAVSHNNPWALNLRASIERATDSVQTARRTQELAVAIRPEDPAMMFNLALLWRAEGDDAKARLCCDETLLLDPEFAPAKKLRAELPA
jgi:tetratricopeptide (TPR) repeat protein